jgi:hypothetical protein
VVRTIADVIVQVSTVARQPYNLGFRCFSSLSLSTRNVFSLVSGLNGSDPNSEGGFLKSM